jgi:chromosome partitioning protein
MTAASLGFGLAKKGKKVLLLDCDSQHSLTVCMGERTPDKLTVTLSSVLTDIINERDTDPTAGILQHSEGVDFLPANSGLTGIELALTQLLGREMVLRQYIEKVKHSYDFVIIDTAPSLDLLTVNALAAADTVIIPVCPKYLDALGLELLLKAVAQIKRQINPALAIGGILMTIVDRRANLTREVISSIEQAYGNNIRIFGEHIPRSVKAAECSSQGVSIYSLDPNGKVAAAYSSLVGEVMCRA